MSRHQREAHLHQNGGTGGSHDAVVGGGRHAHTQNDAADHRQQQADHGSVACHLHDGIDKDGSKTGDGDTAGDHTSHGTGHSHGDGALGTGLQCLHDFTEGQPLILVQEAHHDGGQNGHRRGELHGAAAGGDQEDQQGQRYDEIGTLGKLAPGDHLGLGHTLQSQLLGFQMDGDENAGEVQHGGKDGLYSYLRIWDIHVLCHQERRCAHDGGHDLTAGRGGSLHRAGELRLVTGFLHHGDGDGAGGHGVAHGGAGHHAAQGGGNDRHLGGAAGRPARQTVGEADEEVGDAGALQKCAKDDEQHNVGVADAYRRTDDAAGGVEQLIDDVLQRLVEAGVPAELVIERVDQQQAQHHQNGQAHAPAAQLDQYHNTDGTDDDVDGLKLGGQLNDGKCIDGKIEEAASAQNHQEPVIPGHMVHPGSALSGGIHQIADDDDKAQEQGQPPLRKRLAEQGHQDTID